MGSITLQFSRQDDLGSRLIRFFEHGQSWSHVDAVLPDGSLAGARSDICMGIPSGFQIRPNGYSKFAATKRITIKCTDGQEAKHLAWQYQQVGKKYDKLAIFAFIINRDWRENDTWICSEAQLRVLEPDLVGILPYMIAINANKVTPADLYLILSVLTDVWAS